MKKNITLIIIINLLLAFTKYLLIVDSGAISSVVIGLILSLIVDVLINFIIIKILRKRNKDNKIKYYQLLLISIIITFIDYILILCDIL